MSLYRRRLQKTLIPVLLLAISIPQGIIPYCRIMRKMSETKKVCGLCGLAIEKPLFSLKIQDTEV
jgi:hypothetical protein